MLLLGLLNGFSSRIQDNPDVPSDVKAQISKATETGIPIVTTDQAYQGLRDAGLSAADATTVTDDYAKAQLNALRHRCSPLRSWQCSRSGLRGGCPESEKKPPRVLAGQWTSETFITTIDSPSRRFATRIDTVPTVPRSATRA